MLFVPALGGYVPYRDKNMRTSVENIFVAGDAAGVEEASSAMVAGRLAGLSAAEYLGFNISNINRKKTDCLNQLNSLRHDTAGERIAAGIKLVTLEK